MYETQPLDLLNFPQSMYTQKCGGQTNWIHVPTNIKWMPSQTDLAECLSE